MAADYAVLAPIYEEIGLANFAATMTERLINFVQRRDWMGRRILDLGSGTGASMVWLAQHGYFVTGVDNAPLMLEIARAKLAENERHADYVLHNRDVRTLGQDLGPFDLVLALDVMNELNSLRDLESVFKDVYALLSPGKLMIFDLHTIQGLTEAGTVGDQIVQNDDDLTVVCANNYDYERQIHEQKYLIFNRDQAMWQRSEVTRVLRAFSVQAVATLVQRNGFGMLNVLDMRLEAFDPNTSQAGRVFFIVEKRAGGVGTHE